MCKKNELVQKEIAMTGNDNRVSVSRAQQRQEIRVCPLLYSRIHLAVQIEYAAPYS